jgi:predicted Zn-dependent peptidase
MLDRTLAPPFVKSTSFQLPEVSKSTLANGIKFYHLDGIQQDIVKIEVIFSAGKWFEPKPEISHFTVQMLDKGTSKMSSSQIAEFFDLYGAHIEFSSNLDYASASLYTLSKHLSVLSPVFFELLANPSFQSDELTQMKDHFIQALRVKDEKTSYVASKMIRENIFGKSHPYGNTAEVEDVLAIDTHDLLSYFKERIKPSHVFVLGQIQTHDFIDLQKNFSSISINNPENPSYGLTKAMPSLIHVEKESSVQSSIRLGKRTIQRNHTDYGDLLILNYYLGGYFGSKLMKNLREEKGLTYGISSSISSFKNDSLLLIGTDINKENRGLAVEEIQKEIKLLQSIISESELNLAKRHFIGSLQGEIASPFSILGKIKNIELNELADDYYQTLINKIDSVPSKTLLQTASTYFDPDSFTVVTVG